MLTKSMAIKEMDDKGIGLAQLAILSEVDHDGDTYEAGAFSWKEGGEQWAPIIVAHDRWSMPFGKARVYEEGDAALAELHLNLDTQAGRDWHAALKFDLSTGKAVQEWSYGYDALDADYQVRSQGNVRRLKKLDVEEVSTVVRGAGRGTRTLSMKEARGILRGGLKGKAFDTLIADLDELAQVVSADPNMLSATGRKQLDQIHGALGRSLVVPAEIGEKERALIDSAIGAHLEHLSRRHLAR